MVLIGDIVGDDEDAVARATSEVVRIANSRTGEGFVAVNAEARKKFWLDRSRTAAIAQHTNAFKINEDVVIPLERMGEYTDAIERINIELSIKNKLELLDAAAGLHSAGELQLGKVDDPDLERAVASRSCWAIASSRPSSCSPTPARAGHYLLSISTRRSPRRCRELLRSASSRCAATSSSASSASPDVRVFDLLQDRSIRTSWKTGGARATCGASSPARAFAPVLAGSARRFTSDVLRGRVWIALHMHAGDGNVHTNIPVNSDDYEMLQEANRAVARIMQIARDLDGVISGEHGIGITKLEFLTDDETAEFRRYKSASIRKATSIKRQAPARRRSAQRLHAELQSDGPRVADHAAVRHQLDLRCDQGLPALRQVQAGVRDARAARQSALFAAQQDPRDLAADRSVPVRGADAPRRVDPALRTSSATSPITAPSATSA